MQKNNELPPVDDARGWATFMQANPLPMRLHSNPSVISRLLKKIPPCDLIDAHIAFKDLSRRSNEQSYLFHAVYFAIAIRVRRRTSREKSLLDYGIDLAHDITMDLFEIASDSTHQHHEAMCTYFPTVVKRRTINAVEKHKRENPPTTDLDTPVANPKDPTAMASFSTPAEAELIMIAKDAAKLMTPAVRTAYENAFNGIDDEGIGERSRYRNRARALKIVKGELDQSFVNGLDDEDDFFIIKNLPDPVDVCLIAFHFACDHPTETDVARWCEVFPQFAETIRNEAEIARTLLDDDEECPDLTSDDIASLLPTLYKLLGH